MVVTNLLHAGHRIAGILTAPGRGLSDSEETEALYVLNAMLDSWATERLLVYATLRSTFPVTAFKGQYTIGLPSNTGTWDTTTSSWDQQQQSWDQTGYSPDWKLPRPPRIERAGYVYLSSDPPVEQPMDVMSDQEWESLSPKTLTGAIPYKIYYQAFVPLGVVNVWPIPDGSYQIQIAIYSWQQIQQFAGAQDTVYLPTGYQKAIEYSLAVELAMRYPKRAKMSPLALDIAKTSKSKVKTLNSPVWLMQTESAARGSRGGVWSSISGHYLPNGGADY